MSSEQVPAKKLAESTKKSYKDNIRTLFGHMTVSKDWIPNGQATWSKFDTWSLHESQKSVLNESRL